MVKRMMLVKCVIVKCVMVKCGQMYDSQMCDSQICDGQMYDAGQTHDYEWTVDRRAVFGEPVRHKPQLVGEAGNTCNEGVDDV